MGKEGLIRLVRQGLDTRFSGHTRLSNESDDDQETDKESQEEPPQNGDPHSLEEPMEGEESAGKPSLRQLQKRQRWEAALERSKMCNGMTWFISGILFTGVVLFVGFRFPHVFMQLGIGPPLPVGSLNSHAPPVRLHAYVGGNFIEFTETEGETRWETPQILVASRGNVILRGYFSPICVSFPDLVTGTFTASIGSGNSDDRVSFSQEFIVHRGEGCFVFDGEVPEGVTEVAVSISSESGTGVHRKVGVEEVNCESLQSDTRPKSFLWKSDAVVCLDSVFTLGKEQTLTIEPGAIVILRGDGMIKTKGGSVHALGTQQLPILVTRPTMATKDSHLPPVFESVNSFSLWSGIWIADTHEKAYCSKAANPMMKLQGSGVSFLMNGVLSCRKLVSAVNSRLLARDTLISSRFAETQFSFAKSYPVFYKVHWIHQGPDATSGMTDRPSKSAHLVIEDDYAFLLNPEFSRCHFYGMAQSAVSAKNLRELIIDESLIEGCGSFVANVKNVSKLIFKYSFAGGCPHSWFQSDDGSTLNLDFSTLSSNEMVSSSSVRGSTAETRSRRLSSSKSKKSIRDYDSVDKCPSTENLPKIGAGAVHTVFQIQYDGKSAVLVAPQARTEKSSALSVEEILYLRKRLSLHHSSLARLYTWCYVEGKGIAEVREKSDGYESLNAPPSMFRKLTMLERLKLGMDVSRGIQFLHEGTPLGNLVHGDLYTSTTWVRQYVLTHNIVVDFDGIKAQLIDVDEVFKDWNPMDKKRRGDLKHFGLFLLQMLQGKPDVAYKNNPPPPLRDEHCREMPGYCQLIEKCIGRTLYPHLTIDQVGRELVALWNKYRPQMYSPS